MSRNRTFFVVLVAFCGLFGVVTPALAQDADLSRAYKKEFAYLEAQKKALKKRLDEVKGQTRSRVRAAQGEVDRLQGRVVSLSMKADELEEQLLDAQREATAVEDRTETLNGTFELAATTLRKHAITVETEPDEGKEAEHLKKLFAEATKVIAEASSMRNEEGAFFLRDGSRAEGTIVKVGAVASFGVSGANAGALAPAGEGRLKLWPSDASSTANRLVNGSANPTIKIFLYESLDAPVEEKQGKTIYETIQAGGVIGWVIVFIGILSLLLVVFRTVRLVVSGTSTRLVQEILSHVKASKIEAALSAARSGSSPTARVLADTLAHIDRDREVVEDIVSEAILRETPAIERFGNAILVFAAVSPLLGLLGTVTGMISTFDVITEYGTGDPKMLSGGISEALITTQLGLIVAIPSLLLGSLLNSRASGLLDDMEHAALQVVNEAQRAMGEPDGSVSAPSHPEASAE